jgi:hypothetical protein
LITTNRPSLTLAVQFGIKFQKGQKVNKTGNISMSNFTHFDVVVDEVNHVTLHYQN